MARDLNNIKCHVQFCAVPLQAFIHSDLKFPNFCSPGDDQEEIEVEEGVFDSEIDNIGGDLEHEISEDTFDEQDSGTESKNEQSDEKVCCSKSRVDITS